MRAWIAATALLTMGLAQPAFAQGAKYPDRPVRMVIPFPPGGTVDVTARLVGPLVSASMGQQLVLETRTGASGIIGTGFVAQSKPDGYTLLINTTPLVTNTLMYSKVPYDALNDFAPVALLASTPSFVSVHPSVPARNVKELIAIARSRPGALNYGGSGAGTNPHIAGELFNYLAKTEIPVVQYKGGGPALIAAVSGEVSVAFSGIAGAVQFVRNGRLRALGVTSLKPSAALPGVPPIAESLPGYEFSAWFAVVAPKGTPREIIATLNGHFNKAVASPELGKRFADEGIDAIGGTPEQLGTFLENEYKKFARVVKERKLKAD